MHHRSSDLDLQTGLLYCAFFCVVSKWLMVHIMMLCYVLIQIDDTDAVEDIHSLLTDAPTPPGMRKSQVWL